MNTDQSAPQRADTAWLWVAFETERKAYLRAIEGDECSLDERVGLAQAMHRAHDAFYAAITGEKPAGQRMDDALDTIEFARSALLMIDEAGAFAGHSSPKGVCAATDLQITTQAQIKDDRRLGEILADLADAGKIKIDRTRGAREISIRRSASATSERAAQLRQIASMNLTAASRKTGPESTAKEISPKPQKTAVLPRESSWKEISRKWPATKGMPPSIENRIPAELNIDDSYQRSTDTGPSQALIKRIANGWDWRMCMPLVVSKREDGSLWVIDGQHRLAAALLRGDIPFLPCCVGVYGSVADEAAMFVAMNRARRPMNRLDDFHAAIASADNEALTIRRLITGAGFTIARKTGSQSWVPGEVAFTSAVAKVLRKHGEKVCADALNTMSEAFPDEVLNAGSSMFTALTKLAVNPPPDYDPDRMFRALLTRNQREWASFLNETKGGGDERALAMRKVLLMAYEEERETADA